MIESVQVRQRGAYDFETHYDNLCALQDSCPLPAVKAHLSQAVLDINGDRIRAADWMPILKTLHINKSLEFVAFRSYYQPPSEDNEKKALIEKRKTPAIRSKEITYRLCKALKECLAATPSLTCLELQGLPLRERDLSSLMKGLVKNSTLNHLSLEYCRIGDAGLEIASKGVKNCTTINSVNFTGCSLSGRGAEAISKVIKHQAMKRHNEAWRDSLRYRRPDLDRMSGIRRITINNNPMLGDQGAILLAEALKDDLWLKALDMQGCGISTTGAKALLDVLKYNTTLVVLDVRRNPLIDRDVLHSIMEQLMINSNGQDTEYKWIKAEEPEQGKGKMFKKRRTKTLGSSFGRKTTIRITAGAARRRTKSAGAVGVTRKLQPISSEGIKPGPGMPWRTAARANRYRGFPPEHIPGMSSLYENSETGSPLASPDQSASVIITKDDSLYEENDDTFQELERMKLDDTALSTGVKGSRDQRVELEQMRRRVKEEQYARAKLDEKIVALSLENKRLMEDNKNLRKGRPGGRGILDDDSVLDSIEAAFKQFHDFLDLLRDAGLGQLITMAGLDKQGSPFSQQMELTKSYSKAKDKDQSTSTKPLIKLSKAPSSKSNGYFGDISSSNQVLASYGSFEEEHPIKFESVIENRNNIRPHQHSSANDPTMKSVLDETYVELGPGKKDELFEKILQDTSGVFKHLGDSDVLHTSAVSAEGDSRRDSGDEKKVPESSADRVVEGSEGVSGKTVRLRKASASEKDDEKESPEHKSRLSEMNYSMDSFEQSYVSERGEVIHLDGDFDLYGESPSPPPQAVESEDDF